jgi:hypothetical protein
MARYLTTARRALAALAFFGAATGAGSAWAESVQQTLSQLANASPNATQLGLRSRGYALAASDAAGDKAWQYWWNGREAACVVMVTTGSGVDRLAVSSESDCNQMDVDPSRMTSQGKVAVAAAKLLGVKTLMHKSHQRDASRYSDYKGVANFEQGYRDGVAKAPFRERERERNNVAYADGFKVGQAKAQAAPSVVAAPAAAAAIGPDYQNGFRDGFNKQDYRDRDRKNQRYADGYKAGQAKSTAIVASGPDFELGYRDGFNKIEYRDRDRKNQRYADGYKAGQTERDAPALAVARPGLPSAAAAAALPPPTRANDLIGRNAADLDSGMKSLGYTRRAGFTKGRETFSTWRGNTESQCVNVVVRNGKVADMGDIEESSCR